jgi:hypothetical protein
MKTPLLDAIKGEKARELPKLYYDYDECVEVFWYNPWDNQKEKLFMMMWPAHPIEETKKVEEWFQQYAERFTDGAYVERLEAALERALNIFKEYEGFSSMNNYPEHEVRHELCCQIPQIAVDAQQDIARILKADKKND